MNSFILMPCIQTVNDAIAMAEKILKVLQKPWKIEEKVLTITTSMGIAMGHFGEFTKHSLMKKADIALYEAKNNGKNSFELFNDSVQLCL